MNKRDEFLRKIAGDLYETIRRTDEPAYALLSHENIVIRRATLLEFSNHCPPDLRDSFSARCRGLAVQDPDLVVRLMAVNALGRTHSSTGDQEISRFLADLALSQGEKDALGLFAYSALRQVQFGMQLVDIAEMVNLLNHLALSLREDTSVAGRAGAVAPRVEAGKLIETRLGTFDRRFVEMHASPSARTHKGGVNP